MFRTATTRYWLSAIATILAICCASAAATDSGSYLDSCDYQYPGDCNGDPNGDCCIDTFDLVFMQPGYTPVECTCVHPAIFCVDPCDCNPLDPNADELVNITDAVYLIAYIFADGDPPDPYAVCSGDLNCDGIVNVEDAVWFIRLIFSWPPPETCSCEQWLLRNGPPLR